MDPIGPVGKITAASSVNDVSQAYDANKPVQLIDQHAQNAAANIDQKLDAKAIMMQGMLAQMKAKIFSSSDGGANPNYENQY